MPRPRDNAAPRHRSGRKRYGSEKRRAWRNSGKPRVALTTEERRAIAPLIWRRALDNAVTLARDPQLGSEIGRLSMLGVLSDGEAATADPIGEVLGRDALLSGSAPPTVASPSFNRGYGKAAFDPYSGRDDGGRLRFERAAKRAKRAAARIWETIDRTFSGRAGDRAKAVILDLCVHDTHVPSRFHADLVALLHIIGVAEGIMHEGPARRRAATKEARP